MAKSIKSGVLYRDLQVERSAIDEEKRTAELSFSSELPAPRWFGIEILDHSPASVNTERLRTGAALLWNHNSDTQIGVVEKATISPDRRGRALVRFGESSRAEEIWKDVKSGVIRLVSVGYRIHKMVTEKVENGVETMRATDWEPLEISLVSVPVDHTVGVGRSETNQPNDIQIDDSMFTRSLKLDAAAPAVAGNGGAPPAPTPDLVAIRNKEREDALKEERDRVREIKATAARFKTESARTLADTAIESGMKLDEFSRKIIEQETQGRVTPVKTTADIGMEEKDVQRFSLLTAIRSMARHERLEGFEKEVCEAAQKQMKRELRNGNSFVLPNEVSRFHDEIVLRNFLAQRAQNVTTASAGGFTVETQMGPLIEMLRNRTVLGRLGITIMDGLVGDFVMPVQTGGATAYWVSETGTITDSEATFGQKVMVPHRLGAAIPFTMQFLAQTSLSADAFIRNEMDIVLALKKDLAGLLGTGVGGEPLGVANTTGINATVTYGGAATWADIVEHETGINVDNADIGTMGFVIDAATTGKWKTILKDSVAGAGYLLSENMTANGYRVERTQQIVAAHQSFFGVWSQLLLAMWAGREVTVDNITLAKSGQHQIIMNELCDFLVRQPLAFNVSTDSAAQ